MPRSRRSSLRSAPGGALNCAGGQHHKKRVTLLLPFTFVRLSAPGRAGIRDLVFDDDGKDVPVDELVRQAHPLAAVLHGSSPDAGIPEPAHEVPVELGADRLDRAPCPDDQRLFEIGLAALGLEVDTHEPEAVVDRILELLDVVPEWAEIMSGVVPNRS